MRVRTGDVELECASAGSRGRPFVLLHGLGGSSAVWSRLIPLLSNHARVVAPDLRGCGSSSRGERPWTLRQAAEDVELLLEALELEDVVVVGHSLGGVIAQEILVRGCPRVAAAVLVSTSSRIGEQATRNWQRLADIVEARGLSDAPESAARGFAEDFAVANPDILAEQARATAATPPAVYAEQARAASSYDYTEGLRDVRVPVLVVQGLADRLTPPGGSVLLQRAVGDRARLEMIEGAGHNIPIEAPQLLARLLLDFAHAESATGVER